MAIKCCRLTVGDCDLRSGGFQTAGAIWKSPFLGREAFTLIELLIVITIIVILTGLLFPAFRGVQDQAKRVQAKNDLTQIVTSVNAYYTEYGKYPTAGAADVIFGPGSTDNESIFNALRGLDVGLNPRQIVFISPPDAKDQNTPRGGIKASNGRYFDPWGQQYAIALDANYDNSLVNPYTINAGGSPLRNGAIAWSFGRDKQSSSVPGPAADKNAGVAADDVISWQ